MSLFNTTADKQEILDEIRALKRQIAELKGERDAAREELGLADDVVRLKRELTKLEIEKDRQQETHEREKREVKHMVGLEKKRSEFEIDAAKRDTQLSLREENLAADRKRFEDEMTFTRKRFEGEVGYLKELMVEVLDRLPKVDVNQRQTIAVGNGNGNGNGKHADEGDE